MKICVFLSVPLSDKTVALEKEKNMIECSMKKYTSINFMINFSLKKKWENFRAETKRPQVEHSQTENFSTRNNNPLFVASKISCPKTLQFQ